MLLAINFEKYLEVKREAIWTISFKIRTNIEVRKHTFYVLLRRQAVSTIFLKCFFEFVFNPAQLAFAGAFRRKFHGKNFHFFFTDRICIPT